MSISSVLTMLAPPRSGGVGLTRCQRLPATLHRPCEHQAALAHRAALALWHASAPLCGCRPHSQHSSQRWSQEGVPLVGEVPPGAWLCPSACSPVRQPRHQLELTSGREAPAWAAPRCAAAYSRSNASSRGRPCRGIPCAIVLSRRHAREEGAFPRLQAAAANAGGRWVPGESFGPIPRCWRGALQLGCDRLLCCSMHAVWWVAGEGAGGGLAWRPGGQRQGRAARRAAPPGWAPGYRTMVRGGNAMACAGCRRGAR